MGDDPDEEPEEGQEEEEVYDGRPQVTYTEDAAYQAYENAYKVLEELENHIRPEEERQAGDLLEGSEQARKALYDAKRAVNRRWRTYVQIHHENVQMPRDPRKKLKRTTWENLARTEKIKAQDGAPPVSHHKIQGREGQKDLKGVSGFDGDRLRPRLGGARGRGATHTMPDGTVMAGATHGGSKKKKGKKPGGTKPLPDALLEAYQTTQMADFDRRNPRKTKSKKHTKRRVDRSSIPSLKNTLEFVRSQRMRTKLAKDLVDARDGGNDDEVALAETALEDFVKGKIRGSEGLHPRKEGYRKVNLAIQANQDKFKSSITFKKPDPSKMRKLKPKAQREEEKVRQTEDQKKADEQERRRQLDEEVYGEGSAQAQGLIKKFMGENMRYHYVQKEGKASRQGFRFFAPGSRPEDQRQRYGWKVNDQLEPLYEAPNDEDMQDILQPQNQYKTPQQVDQFYRANRMQRARYIDIKATEGDQGLRGPYEPRRAGEDEDAARILATFNPNAMRQGSKSRFIQTMFPDRPTAARRGVRARRATARGRGMDVEYNDSHEIDLRPAHADAVDLLRGGMDGEEEEEPPPYMGAQARDPALPPLNEGKIIANTDEEIEALNQQDYDQLRAMFRTFEDYLTAVNGLQAELAAIDASVETFDAYSIETPPLQILRALSYLGARLPNDDELSMPPPYAPDSMPLWQAQYQTARKYDKVLMLEFPGGGEYVGDRIPSLAVRDLQLQGILTRARATMEKTHNMVLKLSAIRRAQEQRDR